jgi:hypothetical protein
MADPSFAPTCAPSAAIRESVATDMLLQPTGTTVEFSGTAVTAAAITALSRRTVAISFVTRPLPPMRRSAKSRVVAVLMIGTQWRLRHQCATAKQMVPTFIDRGASQSFM